MSRVISQPRRLCEAPSRWRSPSSTAPKPIPERWSDMRLKELDGWLANRTFVALDDFTVADILMTHVLSAASTDRALLKPYPHVRSYLARCMDRPAWKRTFDAYCERVETG